MADSTEVVVIGGGYAGVLAANRLTRRGDVAVTLVNPRPVFVERIRLHQLAGGTHGAVADYRDVLAPRVRLVVDSAVRIGAGERTVALAGGGTLGYDHLVYAAGSGGGRADVPGATEFAHPVATLEDARRLKDALAAAPAAAEVTVVGAGPTGIETAAELAEQGRRVVLACGGVLGPYLHPKGRRSVARRLDRLGVRVLEGPGAAVAAVTADTVRLADGRELPSRVTVWTAGFGVPDLAARSGLRTDTLGRLLTDETLTSVDDPRIVAAGDAAAPSDLPFRMSCQSATRLGAHAADTVLRRIAGQPPEPVNLGFFGQCISLGRGAGIFQFADRDDTATGRYISGRLGARVKEVVCRSTLKHLAHEARKPGSLTWVADGSRRERLQARDRTAPAR
ncbi:FAD-dependent oxidoreductase [Streptomonospora sp. S1-112]|uniref:FAD-dependent oxidoreductase n=1 Tax=Streptomonospora mangrovi TaxID=2883123 RepID=A0A9X3NIV3_9ACTN|nr:FAD-dependent oxidoreductase [Streptomonospora mangrovi]MDA0563875.1 FAD-dependent oxidoreductase [Streptomonospora mangrovi]